MEVALKVLEVFFQGLKKGHRKAPLSKLQNSMNLEAAALLAGLLHRADEFENLVGVADLVIVPAHELHEVIC